MASREQIVAEARAWLGTPWQHQQHLKGVGCDCGGLIRGVMAAVGLGPTDFSCWPGAREFFGYSTQPDGSLLERACDKYLTRIPRADMKAGDALLLITDRHPQHMGILGDYAHGGLSIIHAATAARPPRVIETRLMFSGNLRFVAAFSLVGVA